MFPVEISRNLKRHRNIFKKNCIPQFTQIEFSSHSTERHSTQITANLKSKDIVVIVIIIITTIRPSALRVQLSLPTDFFLMHDGLNPTSRA